MKSDTQSIHAQLPVPHEKRSINPWLLIFGTILGGVVLIAVVLMALTWMAPERKLGENEHRMPDGSILKIEAVTWGTNHGIAFDYSPPGPWRLWDGRSLPITDGGEMTPVLMVWMTHRDGRSGRLLDFDWWGSSAVVNSRGIEVPDYNAKLHEIGPDDIRTNGGGRPFHADHRGWDQWVANSSFPVFRADDGKFQLRVKNTSGEVVATFDLMHSSLPTGKIWQAEELPVTKTQGDLTVTLQRLRPSHKINPAYGLKMKRWYFEPELTVLENGVPTKDWYFGQSLNDPFGFSITTNGQVASAGEPAWRFGLSAYRKDDAEFPASETWTLANISLPPRDTVKMLSDEYTIDGVTIKLVVAAGPGKVSYSTAAPATPPSVVPQFRSHTLSIFDSPGRLEAEIDGTTRKIHVEANWPHIGFEILSEKHWDNVLMKALDDQGRVVPTQPHHAILLTYYFKAEPDAKSLRLSIILPKKPYFFEFFVKPPEFTEDKPMP